MSELQSISEEEDYYEQLFKMAEKEQTGDLYKKELYIMEDDLEKIKSKTKLKVMHDNILQKLINEEYRDFVFNTEVDKEKEKEKEISSQNVKESINTVNDNSNNTNKNGNSKEDNADKEIIEELEYLKELYRLNYLTFSPLSTEYFDNIHNLNNSLSKKNPKFNYENNFQNIDGDNNNINYNIFNEEDKKIKGSKEENLLNILNFD